MTIPVVIYALKDFYLLNELNENIELIKSAGLIGKWQSENIDKNFMRREISGEAKTLTVNNILGCFHLLCVGLFVSLMVFMIEFSKKFVK